PAPPLSSGPAFRAAVNGRSAAVAETPAEEIVEVWIVADLADRRVNVVLDAAEGDRVALEQDVAGAPVAIARLAYRADIHHRLALVEKMDGVDLLRTQEAIRATRPLLDEDAGDVGVTVEAVTIDEAENRIHL